MYVADSEPGLDVIVCNYRTPDDLESFVRSYRAYPASVSCKLWVVDVDPRKEHINRSLQLVEEGDFYISHDQNIGYARAVNDAAQRGRHDVLAIFNADVELSEGALDRCYEALMAHPEWGVLGPRQCDHQGRLTHAGIFGSDDAPRHRGWYASDQGQYQDVSEAYSVSGSAYFVARDVWTMLTDCPIYAEIYPEATGAFLPTFLFYEETWASVHARSHGFKVIYYGEMTIIHQWHQSIQPHGKDDAIGPAKQLFVQMCREHGILHD